MIGYVNPAKRSRVRPLLEQWAGRERALEAACLRNYGVPRLLSRDLFYPPITTLASSPALHEIPAIRVSAGDVLASCYAGAPSAFFTIDLRDDASVSSGKIPAELNVEGRLWRRELVLEGVLRCLDSVKNIVRVEFQNKSRKRLW